MSLNPILREFDEAMKAKNYQLAESLAEQLVSHIEAHRLFGCKYSEVFEVWAKLAKRRKDYQLEVAILQRYFRYLPHEPHAAHECRLLDLLDEASEKARRYVPDRGPCEMCFKPERVLTRIDSGDAICRTCLREFGPHEKAFKVKAYDRQSIKAAGLTLPDNATREETQKLLAIVFRRTIGLPDDATDEDVQLHFAPKPKVFFSKVFGVSYRNSNGVARQSIIERCSVGERLKLEREPENSFNNLAVKVCRMDGDQVGYLGDHILGNDQGIGWCVANDLDAGSTHVVEITDITGVEGNHGINILVSIGVPPQR